MSKKEKMSGKSLEKISGGWDEDEHKGVQFLNEHTLKKCQFCGKSFWCLKDLLDPVNTCLECQQKYYFFKNKKHLPQNFPGISMSKNIKLNETESEKVAGRGDENVEIKTLHDIGMNIDIPGIGQNPKHKYKCSDCGYEFWFREPGGRGRPGAILTKCPSCGSDNVATMKD